ncbi:MAG: hypothetical protein HY717_02075 [Planctomycetes bacterium]|nr:hypothetical protein [Planctomycetota bacterium]
MKQRFFKAVLIALPFCLMISGCGRRESGGQRKPRFAFVNNVRQAVDIPAGKQIFVPTKVVDHRNVDAEEELINQKLALRKRHLSR